ncbi:MAG: hypothetical protein ACRD0K_11270 [Egibacteraceae bacterium]
MSPWASSGGLAALGGQRGPPASDWPPLSGYAVAVAAARLIWPDANRRRRQPVPAGAAGLPRDWAGGGDADRCGWGRDSRTRALTGVGAAATLAVSHTSVRLSGIAWPGRVAATAWWKRL